MFPTHQKTTDTIGNYLLDRLHELGVEHIFGLPGDYVLGFDKLIEDHKKIKFINTTRENTAGYLADAYGRIRGMGVACITYGVGINIVNALAQAYVESSPLVVISGAAGISEFKKNPILHHLINKSSTSYGDTTQLEIFKNITIAQAVLNDPSTALSEIERVLTECLQHKKPVYIELPRDMVNTPIELNYDGPSNTSTNHYHELVEALNEVTSILKEAKNPIIWAGHLIHRFGLATPLLQFAETYHIPIVSTLLGKTVVDETHPLYLGVYQGGMSKNEIRNFVESCDCALILGAILDDVTTGIFTEHIGQKQKIIANQYDLTIGHHQYAHINIIDFIEGLTCLNFKKHFDVDIPKLQMEVFSAQPNKKLTTLRTFECLQKHISSDHLIVTDMGDCLLGCIDLTFPQNSFISNAYYASIGFGTPAAIGAQIAAPHKRVIGIVGDGAFQVTGMELSTALRYHLDPIIIILNNHGYGTERPLLDGEFNDIVDWNYSEIPKILGGGTGVKVNTEEELESALTKAMSNRGNFSIIEVELEKMDFSPALKRLGVLVKERIK